MTWIRLKNKNLQKQLKPLRSLNSMKKKMMLRVEYIYYIIIIIDPGFDVRLIDDIINVFGKGINFIKIKGKSSNPFVEKGLGLNNGTYVELLTLLDTQQLLLVITMVAIINGTSEYFVSSVVNETLEECPLHPAGSSSIPVLDNYISVELLEHERVVIVERDKTYKLLFKEANLCQRSNGRLVSRIIQDLGKLEYFSNSISQIRLLCVRKTIGFCEHKNSCPTIILQGVKSLNIF